MAHESGVVDIACTGTPLGLSEIKGPFVGGDLLRMRVVWRKQGGPGVPSVCKFFYLASFALHTRTWTAPKERVRVLCMCFCN